MTTLRRVSRRLAPVLALVLACAAPVAALPTATSALGPSLVVALQQPATDGFVPVYDLPPEEQLPAAPLLVGAYAFAWVMVFGYLWSLWRRLTKVEKEMGEVARRIDELRRG